MKSATRQYLNRPSLYASALALAAGLLFHDVAQAAPSTDLIVTVRGAGTDGHGAIVKVDALTGTRTLLSDLGAASQGSLLGATVSGISTDIDGNFVVLDRTGGTSGRSIVFRVDRVSGARALVSDFGDAATGPILANPEGIHLLPDGNYFVVEEDHARPGLANLYRVDRVTGQRSVLNDITDPALGPTAVQAERGAIEFVPGGFNLLLSDQNAGTDGHGALFRIDPRTGLRTLLSDLGDPAQGPLQINSEAVLLEADGNIIVIEGDNPNASVLRVDPVSGQRSFVSDFGDPSQGPVGISVGETGTIEADGSLVLVGSVRVAAHEEHEEGEEGEESEEAEEEGVIKRVLVRVDVKTGQRVIFSDFEDPSQGVVGAPSHVALIDSFLGRPATLVGTPEADVLEGTAGDDVILGRGGVDVILGGGGRDLIIAD